MARATRSTWPNGLPSRRPNRSWTSNTDQPACALRSIAWLERPGETDDLVCNGLRRFHGKEVAAGVQVQVGVQQSREGAGHRVDGQVAVRFTPQDQRGHARVAQRLQARCG